MKLPLLALLPLFAFAAETDSPVDAKKGEEDPVEFEVEVDVTCDGQDFKKMDLHNGIYAGKALADSFKKVHAKADGGDHVLSHVVFGGNLEHHMGETEAETNPAAGVKNAYWWWDYGFYYFGGWGCRFCYEPDDDMLEGRAKENDVHKSWESLFNEMLANHPNGAFDGAKDCRITVITEPSLMRPRPEVTHEVFYDVETDSNEENKLVQGPSELKVKQSVQESEEEQFAVEIDFACKGLDPVNDKDLGAYCGMALMESYNDAHKLFDDDHNMKHIHFEGTFDDSATHGANLRSGVKNAYWWWDYGFYYFGGWGCRFCYEPDDDMLGVDRKKKQADVHKVWEDGFTEILKAHPDNAFDGIRKCRITVIRDEDRMRQRVMSE